MASDRVRKLARKHPEAFRKIANAQDDNRVCDHLSDVLQQEQQTQDQARATVSD